MRSTGGNRFIDDNATIEQFADEVVMQLRFMDKYARESSRHFNLAELTIKTKPVNGRISVDVSADLEESMPGEPCDVCGQPPHRHTAPAFADHPYMTGGKP